MKHNRHRSHRQQTATNVCKSVGACEGLNFPLLWRDFMPTYVFVGEGRSQCNVTPVYRDHNRWAKVCVWSLSPRLSSLMENIKFMHLADAFIQRDFTGYTFFYQYVCSLGIEPIIFCVANAMLYH